MTMIKRAIICYLERLISYVWTSYSHTYQYEPSSVEFKVIFPDTTDPVSFKIAVGRKGWKTGWRGETKIIHKVPGYSMSTTHSCTTNLQSIWRIIKFYHLPQANSSRQPTRLRSQVCAPWPPKNKGVREHACSLAPNSGVWSL